jgi:hypothetical protein
MGGSFQTTVMEGWVYESCISDFIFWVYGCSLIFLVDVMCSCIPYTEVAICGLRGWLFGWLIGCLLVDSSIYSMDVLILDDEIDTTASLMATSIPMLIGWSISDLINPNV